METINYQIDPSKKWDYENGFYLTCETNRIGKLLNHLDIYNRILDLPGDILEFGVYKGCSLIRLMSYRNLLENDFSRSIYGFDVFGKFPDDLSLKNDQKFVKEFEKEGGHGICSKQLEFFLNQKGFQNYELIKGNIFDTIPRFIEENPAQKIALLHIDIDVYEPTKFILENFWDKLVSGGILMLDDYGMVEGETKAVDEFFTGKNIQIHKPKYNYIPAFIIKP